MPLARIITNAPEAALSASEYLRGRGYTVEVISPREFRVTPAELELNLEHCPPQQVLPRVLALLEPRAEKTGAPEESAAAVETAPQKPKVPLAFDITGRPVEFGDLDEVVPERRRKRNSPWKALLVTLDRQWAHADAAVTRAWQWVTQGRLGARERRAEETARRAEMWILEEQERARREEERARERAQLALERAAQEQAQVEAERRAAEEGERVRQAAEREAAAAAERERARVAAVHEALIAAQREQARRQAEPAALAAPRVAPASAGDLPQQPPAHPEAAPSSPVPDAMIAEGALQHRHSEAGEAPRLVHRRTGRAARLRQPRGLSAGRWSKALAAAAGTAFLALFGLVAYGSRRPASPLPTGALMNGPFIEQQVPFGATTMRPPVAATPQGSAPAVPNPPAATAAPSSRKPSPAGRPSLRKGNRAPRPSARQLRSNAEDLVMAEDEVVVRHLAPLTQPASKPTSTAGLKR